MTREESAKWLEEHFQPYDDETKQSQAVRIAIKSILAWDGVIREIGEQKLIHTPENLTDDVKSDYFMRSGLSVSLKIIQKYLSEVEK